MASKYQSRLVGMIILVSIAVIVLPDVLDGKKQHYKDDFAAIPLKPRLETTISTPLQEPIEDETQLPPSPVEGTVQQNSSTTVEVSKQPQANTSSSKIKQTETDVAVVQKEEEKNDKVEVTANEVSEKNNYQDNAWIIQLMALKNKDNAQKLVEDLRKRNYQAHVKQENDFSRVIIGPDVSKAKLEKQLIELEKITGAKGQLLKFSPLNP